MPLRPGFCSRPGLASGSARGVSWREVRALGGLASRLWTATPRGSQPCQPPHPPRRQQPGGSSEDGSRSPESQQPPCPWPRSRSGKPRRGSGRSSLAAALSGPSFCAQPRYLGCCSSGTSSSVQTCPGTPGPAPGMLRPGPAGWRDGANERVQALLVSGGGPASAPGSSSQPQTPSPAAPLAGLGGQDGAHTPQSWFPSGSASACQPLPGACGGGGCGEDHPQLRSL